MLGECDDNDHRCYEAPSCTVEYAEAVVAAEVAVLALSQLTNVCGSSYSDAVDNICSNASCPIGDECTDNKICYSFPQSDIQGAGCSTAVGAAPIVVEDVVLVATPAVAAAAPGAVVNDVEAAPIVVVDPIAEMAVPDAVATNAAIAAVVTSVDNVCGSAWNTLKDSTCHIAAKCPGGESSECGEGEICYVNFECTLTHPPTSAPTPEPTPNVGNFCGSSWNTLLTTCEAAARCPGGLSSECGEGEICQVNFECDPEAALAAEAAADAAQAAATAEAAAAAAVPEAAVVAATVESVATEAAVVDAPVTIAATEAPVELTVPVISEEKPVTIVAATSAPVDAAVAEPNHSYCGVRWTTPFDCADSKPCPNGDECAAGTTCFGGTPCATYVPLPAPTGTVMNVCGSDWNTLLETCGTAEPCPDGNVEGACGPGEYCQVDFYCDPEAAIAAAAAAAAAAAPPVEPVPDVPGSRESFVTASPVEVAAADSPGPMAEKPADYSDWEISSPASITTVSAGLGLLSAVLGLFVIC